MAEYMVLHNEPRYRVDEVVNELVERRLAVRAVLQPELDRLYYELVAHYAERIRSGDIQGGFDSVSFGTARWTRDGHLVIDTEQRGLSYGRKPDDQLRSELADETIKFLAGLVDQIAALKKDHHFINLRHIRFGSPRWTRENEIVIDFFHGRRRFTPMDCYWW